MPLQKALQSQGNDLQNIGDVTQAMATSAAFAHKAGFRIIEVHAAAHGYLLHQFLSPLSNHRTDQYGGSFDNRIRLLREFIAAVRSQWPEELPLFVRLSVSEWVEDGWAVEDSVKLARRAGRSDRLLVGRQ